MPEYKKPYTFAQIASHTGIRWFHDTCSGYTWVHTIRQDMGAEVVNVVGSTCTSCGLEVDGPAIAEEVNYQLTHGLILDPSKEKRHEDF